MNAGPEPAPADYFLPAFFLPATVFFLPLRVRTQTNARTRKGKKKTVAGKKKAGKK